ncbi:hypothetical protein HDV00_006594 [Rhizophlyctis rosea]|nr:hypothetical protein HDV00_006594 [Rhizophlyctis rosea]
MLRDWDGSNKEEEIFIDRNGKLYGYIFDFLRDGEKAVLPKKADKLQRLCREAEFLGIEGFKDVAGLC